MAPRANAAFTIVTAARKTAPYIAETLESVLVQPYRDFDYIVGGLTSTQARSAGACGRWRVRDAAVHDAAEEVEPCLTVVDPVAELAEVGLQVRGADAMEDIELPALATGIGDRQ